MGNFKFSVTAYIGDTNIEGNVYWTHFFEWMGKAREAFAIWAVPDIMDIMKAGLALITIETGLKHIKPAFLYDEISIEVGIKEVKKASLQLSFDFINQKSGELIATGWQVIAFGSEGRLVPIPDSISRKAHELLCAEKS